MPLFRVTLRRSAPSQSRTFTACVRQAWPKHCKKRKPRHKPVCFLSIRHLLKQGATSSDWRREEGKGTQGETEIWGSLALTGLSVGTALRRQLAWAAPSPHVTHHRNDFLPCLTLSADALLLRCIKIPPKVLSVYFCRGELWCSWVKPLVFLSTQSCIWHAGP